MNAHEHELILKDEVYTIVSAAMEVSNILGAGFLEAVYQEALELELGLRGVPFMSQLPVQINYKGHVLSKEYVEEAQLLNYLKATGKTVGVLLNFGTPRLEWKRMVFTHRMNTNERKIICVFSFVFILVHLRIIHE